MSIRANFCACPAQIPSSSILLKIMIRFIFTFFEFDHLIAKINDLPIACRN